MVNFIGPNLNWQTAALCIGVDAISQIFVDRFVANPEKTSTTEEVANQAVGLMLGAGLMILMAEPLAAYLATVITPGLIVRIALIQGVAQLAYQLIFPEKTPVVQKPTVEKGPVELNDLKSLVNHYDASWDPSVKEFIGITYDPQRLVKRFNECGTKFDPAVDLEENHGYIEKKEVPTGSKVFVRADLHGDLKSLIENLKAMQSEGLLDENFKCEPGTYMVFCGDYMDRGFYSLEVAEFLATLKLENPDQVFLIRGNHEYLDTNIAFGRDDKNFFDFILKHSEALNKFYESMSLTLYLAEEGGEYVQFTHGLFELHIDPSCMLDSTNTQSTMVVPKNNHSFSTRVKELAESNTYSWQTATKANLAARRIMELKQKETDRSEDLTVYNWGDVYPDQEPLLGKLGYRNWRLPPEDVKQALRLMGETRKVKLLFRGHQHLFQHGKTKDGDVVVTTLPVGADSAGFKRRSEFQGQLDRAYILEVEPKVKAWKKQAFLRKAGETKVEITSAHGIFSEAV